MDFTLSGSNYFELLSLSLAIGNQYACGKVAGMVCVTSVESVTVTVTLASVTVTRYRVTVTVAS